jgi:hypothetical protein
VLGLDAVRLCSVVPLLLLVVAVTNRQVLVYRAGRLNPRRIDVWDDVASQF